MNDIQKVVKDLKEDLEINYIKASCKNLCDIDVLDIICSRCTTVYTYKTVTRYTKEVRDFMQKLFLKYNK